MFVGFLYVYIHHVHRMLPEAGILECPLRNQSKRVIVCGLRMFAGQTLNLTQFACLGVIGDHQILSNSEHVTPTHIFLRMILHQLTKKALYCVTMCNRHNWNFNVTLDTETYDDLCLWRSNSIGQAWPGPDAVPQVVSLGGFWVKLAQTASVVSALPDAHLARIGRPGDPLTHGILGTDVTH